MTDGRHDVASAAPADTTLVEAALRRPRAAMVIVVVLIPAACWLWIAVMARDMYSTMGGASAWMMTPTWDARHVALLWAMWAVMMTAMMLPTSAPLVQLYAAASRHGAPADASQRIYALGFGYVAIWALFSVAATVLQRLLHSALLLTPMMEPASPRFAAAVLACAGVYQLTPLKTACLRACRSPLAFMMRRSYGGRAGAFQLGAAHGIYCLGCCWSLMLMLFAGGVMNLAVIAALTVWVSFEKIAPFGASTQAASGVILIVVAIWMATR